MDEIQVATQPTASGSLDEFPRTPTKAVVEPEATEEAHHVFRDAICYLTDFIERSVLFWDTLRQRADDMIEHERAGKPPLLDFDYELLVDARRFERPVNYALLRITRAGDACLDACFDERKPPVIVVDPRAGHGPGIGGFKRDSEVGMAMHEGHTVYFVIFFPEPCPGQTLADVLRALRHFVDEVARRHPGKPPILYGNCQAGWAITLLSADCEGLVGPAVLNGSPLSYWAGESGLNPMRLAAGFVGGTWLTHFLADLGSGRFDGAWLVANFENLKPEAVWEKYSTLFTHIDTERERFLAFERWWSGFYFLSREEIVATVENLFVGNRFEEGKVPICECCYADLRRIRNPLVIFASWGDNITPPHQALGWIPAVYRDTDDLKAAGQRIVYLTDPHAGHLGLFVSASVARLEHRAILESLEQIEALEPGLYELKIVSPTGNPDCRQPQYQVHFEARRVEDLMFDTPREAFERVRRISELNERSYRTFVSPFVRAWSNPWTAATLEWTHPMRTSRYLFSQAFAPWMNVVAWHAPMLERHRTPLSTENPYLIWERAAIQQVSRAISTARTLRDSVAEQTFSLLFG
ncbi:DUF3141 domain-containing protein [Burkholderia pseudomultivorans]|nr:DUF3141 domain-containing protein [Burkholderia pseudomultivorans]MBF5008689.1 DUF3141 domain-containing protein [Burkholderia pseudomultivorans]